MTIVNRKDGTQVVVDPKVALDNARDISGTTVLIRKDLADAEVRDGQPCIDRRDEVPDIYVWAQASA